MLSFIKPLLVGFIRTILRFFFGISFFPSSDTTPTGKDVKKWVHEKIEGKRVVLFSKTWCPFCWKAKKVLKPYVGNEIPADEYEAIELENDPDCIPIQDYLQELTGERTVPRVFIGGTCIGGGNETAALERQGQLKTLLCCD